MLRSVLELDVMLRVPAVAVIAVVGVVMLVGVVSSWIRMVGIADMGGRHSVGPLVNSMGIRFIDRFRGSVGIYRYVVSISGHTP